MEQLMTSEEVAELLHVDLVTIRRLINRGELSAYRIGDDYRFAPSDLADYLQRQHVSARARDESETDPFTPLLLKVIQHRPLLSLLTNSITASRDWHATC